MLEEKIRRDKVKLSISHYATTLNRQTVKRSLAERIQTKNVVNVFVVIVIIYTCSKRVDLPWISKVLFPLNRVFGITSSS